MSVTEMSDERAGKKANCLICRAGGVISFNMQYAMRNSASDLPHDRSIYIKPVPLKSGTLHECNACGSHWYLDSEERYMNYVEESRVPLILEWSSKVITLAETQKAALTRIGGIPMSGYGYRSNETPCSVKTRSGELLELSIITIQKHAPFEDWKTYRLASEIEEIAPSEYALPLDVRWATFNAGEISMGFAPTLVSLSDGRKVALNWGQSFLKTTGVAAAETRVVREKINRSRPPEVYSLNENAVYFIADPDKDETELSDRAFNIRPPKPGLFQSLSRLLGGGFQGRQE